MRFLRKEAFRERTQTRYKQVFSKEVPNRIDCLWADIGRKHEKKGRENGGQ